MHSHLTPLARALVEADRGLVHRALNDDPLGIKQPSSEVLGACLRLERMGAAVRVAAETTVHVVAGTTKRVKKNMTKAATAGRVKAQEPVITARRQWIQVTCREGGRSIDEPELTGWLINMYGVPKTEKEDLKR